MDKGLKYKKHKTPKNLAPYIYMLVFAAFGVTLLFKGFASSTTGVYSGVFAGGDSSLGDVFAFEDISGKKVSIVNSFSSWGASDNSLKTNFLNNVRSHGSIPMVTWEPWDTSNGVNQPNYSLQSIIDGQHDAYITSWATSVKNWNGPMLLRFAHEMNGNWYPWSEQVNGNQSGQYIQAWRHVHDIFKRVGANKVTWVWCVNKIYSGSTDVNSLYPGDLYVDWTGFDAYNRGTSPGTSGNQFGTGTWQNFGELVKPTYQALNSVASGKPQMLAEFGTVEQGGDKADWFRKTLKYELKANYPRIKAIVYFNQNKIYDNRIDTSQTALDAYKEGITLSYYAANDYANSNSKSSPIPGKVQPILFDAQSTDITGPFVTITSPNSTSLSQNTQQTISVDARDRSGVGKVDFYIDDVLTCSDNSAPYACTFSTSTSSSSMKVKAVASDNAGNLSVTQTSYQIL